MNCDHHIEG